MKKVITYGTFELIFFMVYGNFIFFAEQISAFSFRVIGADDMDPRHIFIWQKKKIWYCWKGLRQPTVLVSSSF